MESFMVKSWVKMYFFPILLHLIRSRWTTKKKSRRSVNNTYLCCNCYLIIVVFPYSKCKNPFSTHLCQLDECYDFNLISFYLAKCSRMCWSFFFFFAFFPPFSVLPVPFCPECPVQQSGVSSCFDENNSKKKPADSCGGFKKNKSNKQIMVCSDCREEFWS